MRRSQLASGCCDVFFSSFPPSLVLFADGKLYLPGLPVLSLCFSLSFCSRSCRVRNGWRKRGKQGGLGKTAAAALAFPLPCLPAKTQIHSGWPGPLEALHSFHSSSDAESAGKGACRPRLACVGRRAGEGGSAISFFWRRLGAARGDAGTMSA
ncbi:hypothetical protein VTJ83DRAFT_3733 [Remersonia thermophila]|uniref:Uncharacterized protein n=1 Tax=Remersonia thermophila TaxID=72144 RepID=A0ABR4DF45_9PEZI